MPRYTLCPYYIDENKQTISCEDVCRSYDSLDEKWAWMDMYCDSWDWMKCPYAVDITEAYKRAEEGDSMAIEEQEIKALKKENHALRTKLGTQTKKAERLEKKVEEQKELIKSYQRRNEALYKKWRDAFEKVRGEDDQIWNEMVTLTHIYEQRMAYLIDCHCPDSRLYEQDVERWACDREFTIIHEQDDSGRYWKVVFNEDGHEDTDIQTEEQK